MGSGLPGEEGVAYCEYNKKNTALEARRLTFLCWVLHELASHSSALSIMRGSGVMMSKISPNSYQGVYHFSDNWVISDLEKEQLDSKKLTSKGTKTAG